MGLPEEPMGFATLYPSYDYSFVVAGIAGAPSPSRL
jgi:hypothetical protein